ncbi:hypothetical protein DFP72DRAFT_1074227 [Ephemerocybe angulata]|uniref:Uncharacterized protein n=1 Tax=Ephemerocybe angulata TaxID=980116 RepID=A0A8H6HKZ8_9AGAR|nr:hypothetical protein DFP72DRAFT_1074227 [Tulosesus angulatus]
MAKSPRALSTATSKIKLTPTDIALERLHKLSRCVDKHMGDDAQLKFLQDICNRFMEEGSRVNHAAEEWKAARDTLDKHIAAFESFLQSVCEIHSKILQLCGVGTELARVQEVQNKIRTTLRCMEDLNTYAMLGDEQFTDLLENREFLFQRLLI